MCGFRGPFTNSRALPVTRPDMIVQDECCRESEPWACLKEGISGIIWNRGRIGVGGADSRSQNFGARKSTTRAPRRVYGYYPNQNPTIVETKIRLVIHVLQQSRSCHAPSTCSRIGTVGECQSTKGTIVD